MLKEKRKQSKDEDNDSSSRKRRKADLSKPVSFVSTATRTEPESSRSRPEGAYDVFLSFRGEDTRKTFTDHLYTALVQAGIRAFRDDDDLPRGEEISDHLLRAIQESKISIVVFSKGYASSRWCLNELVEILECKKRKTGQIVLPIFYDIDPSDVRKQTGSFAKAFDKHEKRFEEKLVKEWRKALEDAANLSGRSLNNMANGHEAKFIKKIIKDVLNKLDPKYLYVPEHLVGMDKLAHDIFDFLSTATDDVRIAGIHGMPGIGKTTIAKVVFKQLCDRFEDSCFLSNINIETPKKLTGLVGFQTQLLREILKQGVPNFECVDRGKVLIKERLRGKRVLVVADDVAHLDQLKALMGERSWFGLGSRVIITTRDSNLLREADRTYQIEELKPDESLQLFSWHAFKDSKPAKDYIKLSKDAVDYCGGLPLALEVMGACLSGKNRDGWKCVIEKLRRIPNHDIQGRLRISFDALDGEELQNAFLDIACFFIDRKKEYVAKVLGARCGYNPEVDLQTLHERSLIKVLGETVTMHDLLRDMGREVVRDKFPKEPGKRTRIWNQEDAWNVLEQQKGTVVVEGLALDVRASEAKALCAGSFAEMKRLNLLQINGVHLTGSFKLLSKELMWICWHRCPLKDFPSDFTADYLAVLDMQYSNLKELWKGKKAMCNRGHGYRINFSLEHDELHEMPDWMSYRGEGCSLSFHIPPVFHGLVLWLEKGTHMYTYTNIIIIIRNKSNGRILFKDKRAQIGIHIFMQGWLRYISRSEMAMEDYCGDELELYISSEPTDYALRKGKSLKPSVKECGVHVIAGKSDSLKKSAVERDTVMLSPPLYHLLPHPHRGSITTSTPKQWCDFLLAELQNHSLGLLLLGREDLE
uniref:TIR domain-containing protein n=2 Tax=Populus trichocarpa TaxID=3694 RepID=A0A3N7F9M8_POPTR|eukprot:XP_024447707.1 TMV resistance protein N isoform X2 [Populus trichocarpa]